MTRETPPLLHLTFLTFFLEQQYNTLYIFLFRQYQNVEELGAILNTSLYHVSYDNENAVTVYEISTHSPLKFILKGKYPIWLNIATLVFICSTAVSQVVPEAARTDFSITIRKLLIESERDILEKEELEAKIRNLNAKTKKIEAETRKIKLRDLDEYPSENTPSTNEIPETSLPVLIRSGNTPIYKQIEDKKGSLATLPPRKDLYCAVRLLREEGLLTNNLKDEELANILEIIEGNFQNGYATLTKQIGDLDIDLKKVKSIDQESDNEGNEDA